MPRAIVAMSGGVDSSVALSLSKKKYDDVIGITMKLFDDQNSADIEKACCSVNDVYDAKAVASKLDLKHYTLNMQDDFKKFVIDNFVDEYEKGRTPNPCIECNRHLKYDILLKKLDEFNFDKLITGHYAKIEKSNGHYVLRKAKDRHKDQTYFLYMLSQDMLARIDFPLGNYTKDEIRAIASTEGFINAKKKDSQDICFVKNEKYYDFIKKYTGKNYESGNFMDMTGKVIGTHEGIINYTVGQRRGVGLALGYPAFVTKIDVKNNTVYIGKEDDLFVQEFYLTNINIIIPDDLANPTSMEIQCRYNAEPVKCEAVRMSKDKIKVTLSEPQKRIAQGQAGVLYDNEIVVGGGTIVLDD